MNPKGVGDKNKRTDEPRARPVRGGNTGDKVMGPRAMGEPQRCPQGISKGATEVCSHQKREKTPEKKGERKKGGKKKEKKKKEEERKREKKVKERGERQLSSTICGPQSSLWGSNRHLEGPSVP